MSCHLTKHRRGFPFGLTEVTNMHAKSNNTGVTFSILKLKQGESNQFNSPDELAFLHMDGEIVVTVGNQVHRNKRSSIFDEQPFAVRVCRDVQVTVHALAEAECAIFETENLRKFPNAIYLPKDGKDEHRGEGLMEDTS